MPNVITLYGADHHVVGRCNQHCYNAVDRKRSCICGGINNGVGLAQARSNVPKVLKHIASRPDHSERYTIKVLAGSQGQSLTFEEPDVSTRRRDELKAALQGRLPIIPTPGTNDPRQ